MKRYWRTIIFTLFVLAFVVTVPLVMLTTAGYRYNLLRGRVEMTGIIQARSNPRGATVWINDVAQATTTPLEVRRVLAEDYRVRLTLDGYLPWEKTLRVEQGQTAFTAVVTMLRDSLPSLVMEGKFTATSWNPGGDRLAYIRTVDSLQEIGLWSAIGSPVTLARLTADPKALSLAWSPDGNRLLTADIADGKVALTVYAPGTNRQPLSLGQALPHGVASVKWAPDGQSLLVIAETGVFAVAADDGTVTPLSVGKNFADATTRDGVAYLIGRDADGKTTLLRNDGKTAARVIAYLPDELCRFRAWRGVNLQIADLRRGRLLVVGTDGQAKNELSGTEMSVAPDGRLALWNDFELYAAASDGSKSELLTRLSTPLRSCVWHPNGTHLVCATDEKVFAIELDGRDRRNVWDLTRLTGAGDLNVQALGPRLRFTGTIGNQSGLFMRDL